MKRGDIWLVALDPTVGSEIRKTRPCLIVSPDDLNGRRRTLLVAPMTSHGRSAPFKVALHFRQVDGFVLPDRLRTVDRQRLSKRLGAVEASVLDEVLSVLREMFSA